MSLLTALRKQAEVFLTAHASRPEIVLDDEHRNLSIGWDHDCATDSFAGIRAVAAILPCESKTGAEKDAFKRLPIDWRNPRHRPLNADRDFAPFDSDPLRTFPIIPFGSPITRLLEHFIERSHVGTSGDKPAHRLIDCAPRFVRRRTEARNVKRHRMGNVLVALAPNPNGVVDVHRRHDPTRLHFYQGGFSR